MFPSNQGTNMRNYGSTSSSTATTVPDVNFAGFSPTEFISLSDNVAQNVIAIKTSWQQLEKALKNLGTSRDTKSSRDKVSQIQLTTNNKIRTTTNDLNRLSMLVRAGGDKKQKLQVEKLTSDFQNVMEKYSSTQQLIIRQSKQILLRNVSIEDDNAQSRQMEDPADKHMRTQAQKQAERDLQFEQDMLLDRQERIKQLENYVIDVNDIMRSLGSLVQQQSEPINTIQSSIDDVQSQVEAGTSELIKASRSASSYRRKILILLIIAVIVGVIVVAIIVSKLKS